MKITIEMLEKMGACKNGLDQFADSYPDGTTIKNLVEKINNKHWLGWLVSRRVKITRACLAAGADVHAYNDFALRNAAKGGRYEIVKLLVEAGADVHAEDDFALREAAENGRFEIVKYLVEAGADVHAWYGCALRMAKKENHTKIIEYLENHIEKETK